MISKASVSKKRTMYFFPFLEAILKHLMYSISYFFSHTVNLNETLLPTVSSSIRTSACLWLKGRAQRQLQRFKSIISRLRTHGCRGTFLTPGEFIFLKKISNLLCGNFYFLKYIHMNSFKNFYSDADV